MCFLFLDIVFLWLQLLLLLVFENECRPNDADVQINKNVFKFRHINRCHRNEFYDLDFFTCLPCDESNADVMQSNDKFSCQCASTAITIAVYDTTQRGPICIKPCSAGHHSDFASTKNCLPAPSLDNNITIISCKFKYVNLTIPPISHAQIDSFSNVRITLSNPNLNENCTQCDLKYNFHYQDYCILNALLKPYLNYNANRQQSSITVDFKDLKFIAFFCLSLYNATACNHLANLCIITHYNFDKYSPCSAFILSQTSESLLRYAQLDEQLKMVRPFIFYKKGKQTRKMLAEPVKDAVYTLASKQKDLRPNLLHFFATVYAIDGTLSRWGSFRSSHVNLCQLFTQSSSASLLEFRFGRLFEEKTCQLSLENIIDLAMIYGNKYFMSIYLNITTYETNTKQTLLQCVPVLIESLSPENQRQEIEEWQLVKRFQLIETQNRDDFGPQKPSYEDAHKLQLYKRIRYVEKFEISYNILENTRITIPLIKLRFRTIELSTNSSLDQVYPFSFRIKFNIKGEHNDTSILIDEILFLVLLLVASIATCLSTYNFKNRRTQQPAGTELCDLTCLAEFLLLLITNVANAFLIFFLIHISYRSVAYLAQRNVTITLPIVEYRGSLDMLIYAALILKCMYLSIYFWRLGHVELYFIDWERPKACDSNHFNFKNNLETSSVCSNVRSFVSENNVSAWRMFFIANEWITLSCKQNTCIFIRGIFSLICFNLLDRSHNMQRDATLHLFAFTAIYSAIYMLQLFFHYYLVNRIFGCPLQTFVDTCSLANISVFTLLEASYGFYIHGRSPHGFSDTDISTMLLQLQRESQNMCGKRGLLSDSDQQTYIILPPINLRIYCKNLLIPFQKTCNLSQAHFKKEATSTEGNVEKTSIAFNSVNRFFCAFIDHAIRDMDYIIKEKTFLEKLLSSEFDNYLTSNKGTFYIDTSFAFSQLFLYGNGTKILIMELLLLMTLLMITTNLLASLVVVCLVNKLFERLYRTWMRQNVATKTLIDRRFLI